MNIIYEYIFYIFYIYLIVYFSIKITPQLFIVSIFFAYCFYTTWILYIDCNSYFIQDLTKKTLFTTSYSLFCCLSYVFIHYSYPIYKKYKLYLATLACSPLFYLIAVKFAEYIFLCEQFHTINYVLNKAFQQFDYF